MKNMVARAENFTMIDGHGRKIDYLRVSLIDRCNLRCVYCMPEDGVDMVAHEEILTYEEVIRLVKVFAGLGFRKIKLTGGEPLVRRDVAHLVKEIKSIDGIEKVTLTTNGTLLAGIMEELADAGIDGINLSLDTLNPEIYKKIVRRDQFDKAMEGFEAALKYPQIPLKVNCVPMGMEGQNVLELAELARKYPVHVRFIEMMPIGLGKQFYFCSEESILQGLKERYGAYVPYEKKLGNGPGHYYSFPGFLGKIGFISAISHKFCDSCNRVRLTSLGYLKSCLQYDIGTDLKKLLREGVDEEILRNAIKETIQKKPIGHQFGSQPKDHAEEHMMAQIGG